MDNVVPLFPQPTFDQHLNEVSQQIYRTLLTTDSTGELQFPSESEVIDEVKTYLITTDIKYDAEQQALLCAYTLCKMYGSLRAVWINR